MVDPIVTPPHPPVTVPAPLSPTVDFNPPMVGTASPFLRVDGQNRDTILEAIRAWARGPLFDWAGAWQNDLNGWLGDTENWLGQWNDEVVRYAEDVMQAVVDNSIELQDPVVAQLVENAASESFKAMGAVFAPYRAWDGLAYPPRIPGTLNIFVGPVDPGLLMAENDVWQMPDVTTIPEVASQILTDGSALNEAVKSVSQQTFIKSASEMAVNSVEPAPLSYIPAGATSANGTVVRKMRPDGPSQVSALFEVPRGWKSVKFAVWYTHETPNPAASGIRWQVSVQEIVVGGIISESAQWTQAITDTINAAMLIRKPSLPTAHILTATAPVMLRVGVYRNAGHSGDTFVGDASLIAVEMSRDS